MAGAGGQGARPHCPDSRDSGFAVDLGPPPADADEKEAPVAEELGRLAFEGVANELEYPSDNEQGEGVHPEMADEDARDANSDRKQNQRDAESVAQPIYRMLVTAGVLRDPLLAGAVA